MCSSSCSLIARSTLPMNPASYMRRSAGSALRASRCTSGRCYSSTRSGRPHSRRSTLPDRKRILLDETLPKLKHRWNETHEIWHSITPWHSEIMLGAMFTRCLATARSRSKRRPILPPGGCCFFVNVSPRRLALLSHQSVSDSKYMGSFSCCLPGRLRYSSGGARR